MIVTSEEWLLRHVGKHVCWTEIHEADKAGSYLYYLDSQLFLFGG